MPKLDVYQGGARVVEIGLGSGECVIGRGREVDLRLADPVVSRIHLVITSTKSGYVALDRSTNGALLGGRPLEGRTALHDGDELTAGSYRLVFRARSSGPEAATSVIRGEPTRIYAKDETGKRSIGRPAVEIFPPGTDPLKKRLRSSVTRIGKHPDNDILLPDEYVSAFHCRIEARDDGLHVRDLGSRNGTFVDGRRGQDFLLVDGAVIEVGRTRMVVSFEKENAKGPASAGCFGAMIGSSAVMKPVFSLLARLAPTDLTVLLLGESGTGKELAACALHAQGHRSAGPFIPVNLAALPREVVESELFGHEKGAFTGADSGRAGAFREAEGGTLFLDEVAEIPPATQAKLLRVLESRKVKPVGADREIAVDTRLVAATNRRLEDEVAAGRFREDLYYRLYVVPVVLPPLRARRGEIPLLADHILGEAPAEGRKTLTTEALEILEGHPWPGNVRELRNVLTRAAVLADGPVIRPEHIAFPPVTEGGKGGEAGGAGGKTLAEMEAVAIRRRLGDNNWVYRRAALSLGISPSTLKEKCRKYGILRTES